MKPRHFLITLLALLTSITASAYEWTDANGTEWSFTVSGSNATLYKGASTPCVSGTIPSDLIIPSKVYISETDYNVTSIGHYAFFNCSRLTSITLPDGVTSIGYDVFNGCSDLTSINIPDGVTSIGSGAFNGCSSLTSINIPDGVTSIGYGLFSGCSNLTSITIPDGLTSIGDNSFYGCSSLTSINIPDGVTSIGGSVFYGCSSLTSINIPNGVTSIGNYAFWRCYSLASINIPDGVTYIGHYAFYGCSSLSSITIPDGVRSIGDNSFSGCSSLTSINIPDDVTSIGSYALPGSIIYIHFASSTPKVTYSTYSWNNKTTLFVPDDGVEAYKAAWTEYVVQIVPESKSDYVFDVTITANESTSALIEEIGESEALNVVNLKVHGTFNSYDVMVMRNKMKNLRNLDLSDSHVVASSYAYYQSYKTINNIITSYFAPTSIISFKFPKDITALGNYAFHDCEYLRNITLPEGITSIPYSAFRYTGLTSITIPETVTSIGGFAFESSALSSIHFPTNLKTISDGAFEGCGFTEIHLPPYLTSIGNGAFYGCSNLKKIYAYMPDIISINTNTFSDYTHQQLYVPEFLYNNYYYDTNWSQFLNVNKTTLSADDYTKVPTNSDIVMGEDDQRIPDMSNGEHVDGEINSQGSFTVEGDEPQEFNNVDQVLNGEGQGGSLIGEDDGETEGNLTMNTLRVKINVKAGRWYFFCFPYDVTIANCTYPGQYAWRWYDGAERAANGSGGWKAVTGSTLTAGQGYAFQTSHTGNLIVEFSHPKFGGDRPKTLVAHAAANAANASWNLVGNPYSSFYDFLSVDFDSPITVYNSNGTYSAYRPADDECHLQPYEAFFVQKPTEVDAINFEAERRESYNQGQTKKAERTKARRRAGINPERRLINLEMFCGDEQADRTRVVLNEQKSRDYELDCDASKFLSNEAKAQLYSIENGVQMAINERPQQGDIRLGYTAAKAGKLSISASRMDMPMVLVDTKENTTFDLSLGSYDFDTQAGTFNDRFMLRLSGEATAINNMTKKTGVCIGTQEGGIAIGGAEGKTVNVYTTGGAQAAQHSGNGFVALKRGVYVVSVDGVSAKVSVK